jgi:hypothetical protein
MDERLRTADTEEQFQTVGALAREVLIWLAQTVYDRELHGVLEDGKDPSDTDARRMLEAYIERELKGGTNEETRRFAKAAIALAPAVAHKRTATRREATLCAVATETMIQVVEVLANVSRTDDEWVGVEVDGRYIAWEGPNLHALLDRPPLGATQAMEAAIRAVGMTPSYGRRDRLHHHLAQGAHQVYETDRRSWRKELLYRDDGRAVLLVTPGR